MLTRRIAAAALVPPLGYYALTILPLGIPWPWSFPIWHWGIPASGFVLAALVAATTWSWPAERVARLVFWLEATLRFGLAFLLVSFGIAKLYPGQFVSYNRDLDLTLGSVSAFRLAWRFLGYSPFYVGYMAGLEILAGMLLCWSPTVLLGLLLALGVISNIVAIDYAFGIPPLALAATMGLATLVLLGDYLGRLRILVSTAPTGGRSRRGILATITVLLVMVGLSLRDGYGVTRGLGAHAPATGRWEIVGCTPIPDVPICQPVIDTLRPKLYLEIGRWGQFVRGAERSDLSFRYDPTSQQLAIDDLRLGTGTNATFSLRGKVANTDSLATLVVSAPGLPSFDLHLRRTQRLPWFARKGP